MVAERAIFVRFGGKSPKTYPENAKMVGEIMESDHGLYSFFGKSLAEMDIMIKRLLIKFPFLGFNIAPLNRKTKGCHMKTL
uniref:hypothetical protein n=1 Tax=Candidatus Neptunichlamydia sp. REUL1 TaxID=3064277 RepID=UPI00292CF069|nr:hypothetical protein [Candidatus Neptunochlamydia sp. REUL1]